MNVLPLRVPWPEIGRHTDAINFDGVGFPGSFDTEQLSVSLARLDLARRAIGLKEIVLAGSRGIAGVSSVNVSGMDASGTAVGGGFSPRRRNSLYNLELYYPESPFPPIFDELTAWGRPKAVIKVNKSEMEERVKEKNYSNHLLDPKAQAKFLDRALSDGLMMANVEVNAGSLLRWKATAALYGGGALMAAAFLKAGFIEESEVVRAMSSPALIGMLAPQVLNLMRGIQLHGFNSDGVKEFKEHRPSLVGGIAPDRFLIGLGALSAGKFIHKRRLS